MENTILYHLPTAIRAFWFGLDSAPVCLAIVKTLKSKFESNVQILVQMQLGTN